MYCANSLPSHRSFERSCRPSEKQAFTESLSKINWRSLYNLYTPTEKINVFMTQVAEKMDENLPLRYVKRHPMDKPWITPDIKIAIKKRQHYWLKGYFHEYTFYRNKPGSCAVEPVVYFTYQLRKIPETVIQENGGTILND